MVETCPMNARLYHGLMLCSGLVLILTWLSGCQTPRQSASNDTTQTDRLIRTYPELRSGRFAIISDYENASHMELVHLSGASEQARCVLDTRRGRNDTGRHCLSFTAGSAHDAVVFSNQHAENWFLRRDWRDYDLLMMSVYSPIQHTQLQLTISAGSPRDRTSVETLLQLHHGWNELSIDLAEVGERVPLDDVREMSLSLSQISKPINLLVDDIILTGHRESMLGDPENKEGRLYVQSVGRRWRIGAGAKFELVFANGQITSWYHLPSDPYRLHNLCQHTALGPTPIRAELSSVTANDFDELGRRVVVHSQLAEMNDIRIVLETTWRFVDDPAQAYANRPRQRWTYTIYATGQVFVDVQATQRSANANTGDMGLAVSLATRDGDLVQTHNPSETQSATDAPPYALVRFRTADAALLFMAQSNHAEAHSQMVEQLSRDQDRTTIVYLANTGSETMAHWTAQLFLTSSQSLSDAEAQQRALAFGRGVSVELELGEAQNSQGHTTSQAWLNRATGSISLIPTQGRIRLRLPGAPQTLFSPAFQVTGPADASAWVYVDNLLIKHTSHNKHGQLLFQLPQVIQKPTVVEVLYQQD